MAAPAPGAARATLEASRARLVFGRAVELSGALFTHAPCASDEVEILSRQAGEPAFSRLAIVKVRNGGFSYRDLPRHSSQYAARPLATPACAPQTSSILSVAVKARVTARAKSDCAASAGVITGRVRPSKNGQRVLLERRFQGVWVTQAQKRLDARSTARFTKLGCGRYRLLWPSQDDLNARGSTALRLR